MWWLHKRSNDSQLIAGSHQTHLIGAQWMNKSAIWYNMIQTFLLCILMIPERDRSQVSLPHSYCPPYLKCCFVSRLLCETGEGQGSGALWSSAGSYCSCARQCQTPLPAEMTLGTRSSCANTATLLSTHSTFRPSQIQLFFLPWTTFLCFISVAFCSAHELRRQAVQGWQMCYCGFSLLCAFLSCEHSCCVSA